MNSYDANQEPDWPSGCSQSLRCQALDEAAHCSICRDFFNTPLSLLCGHSFCAECIRENIQFQERNSGKAVCPQCREPADSRQILANHALRDLVNNYLLARPQLISTSGLAAQGADNQKQSLEESKRRYTRQKGGKKRKISSPNSGDTFVIDLETGSEPEGTGRRLRKRSSAPVYYPDPPTEPEGEAESSDSEASKHSSSSPEPKEGARVEERPSSAAKKKSPAGKDTALPKNWVQCPCCQQNFPMAIFNNHLDSCLEGGGKSDDARPQGNGKPATRGKGGKPALIVPPKLLMAIEKDRTLKDRLKKYNLPTKGSRQELEQRYTRFRVEVQTALDRCESRATYESLARRVTSRETSELNAVGPAASTRPALVKKQAAATASEFDDLIKATRQRSRRQGELANGLKPATPEQESEEASGSQDAHKQRDPDENPASGKENTWGRGFRRSSTGDHHAAPAAPVESGPSQAVKLATGSLNGHANGHSPPALEPVDGRVAISSQSKSLPWSHDKPDALLNDDIIEDSEDEEMMA